jgi:hypothetical protein
MSTFEISGKGFADEQHFRLSELPRTATLPINFLGWKSLIKGLLLPTDHTNFRIKDPKVSLPFYQEILGLELVDT